MLHGSNTHDAWAHRKGQKMRRMTPEVLREWMDMEGECAVSLSEACGVNRMTIGRFLGGGAIRAKSYKALFEVIKKKTPGFLNEEPGARAADPRCHFIASTLRALADSLESGADLGAPLGKLAELGIVAGEIVQEPAKPPKSSPPRRR
jgi:hypothetical protein